MSEKDHAENLISEEETNGVEISTVNVVISAVEEEVNKFVDQKFDAIKSEVLNELDDLANGFPLIDIIKILMELVEEEGGKLKFNGENKCQAVVEICLKLGNELKDDEKDEIKLLASILTDSKSIRKQVNTIMKINNGELKINLEDGLDDEIEIIVACCGGCLNPLFKYLSSKCKCFKAKRSKK